MRAYRIAAAGMLALASAWGTAAAQEQSDTVRLRGAAAAQEQSDTFRLREVVVTATRLPTSLARAPGAVTVLRGDELRAHGIRYVVDALRIVPGVSVADGGGPGGLTSLFMRGGEADYVQVLVDGVKVNEPGGVFNWAHLRADDIDRIEIVRGPTSVLYGSDAVSGVVQIFTRAGGPPRIEVGATGGRGSKVGGDATGTYRADAIDASVTGATAAPGGATLRYGLTVAHFVSNGLYAFNSDYDNTNVSGRAALAGSGADVAVTVRRNSNEFHYPTSGGGAVLDPNQFATGRSLTLGADAGVRLVPTVQLRVLATAHEVDARSEDPADGPDDGTFWSTSDVSRRGIDARVNAFLPRGIVLTGGAAHERQHGTSAYESVSQWGTFADDSDDERSNTGWYAQLHGPLRTRGAATLGARLDDNAAFGTFVTGRAAVNLSVAAMTSVRAAVGSAFREPTFFENYATGAARGNLELEPEQSVSWEAGVEQIMFAGRITLAATWFDQRFTNMIQYTGTPPDADAPNYYNVGAATSRGAELSVHGETSRTTLAASYTYTRTRVTEHGFGGDRAFQDGLPLLRRPAHQAAARALVRLTPVLTASAAMHYTGERDDLDFTDPIEWQGVRTALPAYGTLAVGVEYGVLRRDAANLDISLSARNLLDARYESIYNFPAPGRVLSIGVRAGR